MKIDPQLLIIFSTVVRFGSFSKAADHLDMDKSGVSRAVMRLEQQLRLRLLLRHARAINLTAAGATVHIEAHKIAMALATIQDFAQEEGDKICGTLRVAASSGFGRTHLLPALRDFLRAYPEIKLQLQFHDQHIDLVSAGVDVAYWHARELPDSNMVARKLLEGQPMLAAAPCYLAQKGTPRTPADLEAHTCLALRTNSGTWNTWRFTHQRDAVEVKISASITHNDPLALLQLAEAGAGIVRLDSDLLAPALAAGTLTPLLPDFHPATDGAIYVLHPARQWKSRKTQAFIAFIESHLAFTA